MTKLSLLATSDHSTLYASGTHDYDPCRLYCATCGRDVSTGMRYQLANGHDAAQHVRMFHAEQVAR
jgi:hypothetical protein